MPDIVSLGAAKTYDPETGTYTIPQATVRRVVNPDDPTDVEDYGSLPITCALGVTAIPAAADEATGACAEGVLIEGVGGTNGTIVAAHDTRCADVAGQMGPGDTCLHGTHPDKAKRVVFMAKEDLAAIIVGNDMVFTLDRGGEAITITAWGNTLQMTPDSVILSQGGVEGSPMSWIELKGGAVSIVGAVNAGGTTALPLIQSAGLVAAIGALAAAMTAVGAAPVTGTVLAGALATLGTATAASATKQMTGA
jgi:hypothetical protein